MDTYQELIYVRSYARWIDRLKRRETWDETVTRYFNFFDEHFRAHPNYKAIMETFRWAIGLVYDQEVMPSMRMLWAAGEALRRENLAGYNCVATPVDHVKVFSEILYLSMCGCGVGYSVERQFINKLPLLPKSLSKSQEVIEVADSKLGWAVAVNKFIRAIYNGSIPSMDVSGVRPAGARLKTFGGRAGGPELLTKLQYDITRIFKDAAGERLSSLDCHDIICHIGEAVISGGCRRTAFGSLSNLSDGRMAKCKAGDFGMTNPQRGYANNSVAYTERPDSRKFISEWLKLVESQSGERGIFNRIAAEAQVMRSGRRQGGYDWLMNPCITGDSIIETVLGPMPIQALTRFKELGVYTMLNDGTLGIRTATNIRRTRTRAHLVTVRTQCGDVKCTPEHPFGVKTKQGVKWVAAKDLKLGDKLYKFCRAMANEQQVKVGISGYQCKEHRMVAEYIYGDLKENIVHHIDGDPRNNSIWNLQVLPFGVHSFISNVGHPQWNDTDKVSGQFLKKDITQDKKYLGGLYDTSVQGKAIVIEVIDEGDIAPVFNMRVEETDNFIANKMVVHNCGETILRPRGLCNLTEVIVREGDSHEYLKSKVKAATILGVCQSTLTDFGFVSPSYQRNAEEERLLGVSMTGVRDHFQLQKNEYSTICWLENFQRCAIDTAREMSRLIGINMPAAITTCKPSGTVSQLTGTSSGIHPRYSEYYLRRIRISRTDPLVKLLESSGLPWQPENNYTRETAPTVVFTFPVKSPDGAITTGDLTAIDQLEYWKMFKKYWCEHTASTTIHVRDSEWMEVGAWVYKNWDEIIGLSFLPEDSGSYRQAPFEAITKDEYEAAPKIKIDFTKLSDFEKADNTEGAKEYACAGGGCEI